MKMKTAMFLCLLIIALTGCTEAITEKEQPTTQNGPKAETVGLAAVENVGKDTKVTFVFKNQSKADGTWIS